MTSFKSTWPNLLKLNWRFGLLLILIFGIPRFIIVLEANKTGNYNFTSVIFVVMIVLPFLVLTKKGRHFVGIKRVKSLKWFLYSFLLGVISCIFVFLIGKVLFDGTLSNWFVYISKSFSIDKIGLTNENKFVFFAIFAMVSMIFSPFGEEFLYRGIIHKSFANNFGDNKASIIDSAAFAVTHLAHFGIFYSNNKWNLISVPALLWVIIIYLTGRLFHLCKVKTGSVFGAVISHAGFNLTMVYFIFYHIF